MSKYLTIKEYAEIKGVSPQAVYKRLSTSLKDYYIVVNGKKMLKKSVLGEDELNQVDNQVDVKTVNEAPKVDNDIVRINERNEKIIDDLRAEIREKDKQIKEQSEQLIQLSNRITELFENDQKLFLNNQYLLKYEKESNDENIDKSNEEEDVVVKEIKEKPPKKKGLFGRLFKRNK